MTEIVEPTQQQLIEEDDLKIVDKHSDSSWRHGSYESHVFHRKSDDTYWQVDFRLSSDGETNELTDGGYDICQVFPKEVVQTIYVPKIREEL